MSTKKPYIKLACGYSLRQLQEASTAAREYNFVKHIIDPKNAKISDEHLTAILGKFGTTFQIQGTDTNSNDGFTAPVSMVVEKKSADSFAYSISLPKWQFVPGRIKSLAHEFAHILLHVPKIKQADIAVGEKIRFGHSRRPIFSKEQYEKEFNAKEVSYDDYLEDFNLCEQEADLFADAFLMPLDKIRELKDKKTSPNIVALKFDLMTGDILRRYDQLDHLNTLK